MSTSPTVSAVRGYLIPSPELVQFFGQLVTQLSHFNNVIAIDGPRYRTLTPQERDWIQSEYINFARGVTKTQYVRDSDVDRVFLGPPSVFEAFPLITVAGDDLKIMLASNQFASMQSAMASPTGASQHMMSSPVYFSGNSLPSRSSGRNSSLKQEKIPRPPNSFILYRKTMHPILKGENPHLTNNELSVIIGAQWQNESAEIRAKYKALADKMKLDHLEKYPDYQYRPRKPSEKKRRMSKKKAAALAADSELISVPQKLLPSLGEGYVPSATTPIYATDFTQLGGCWSSERFGSLPAANGLYSQVNRHNESQHTNALAAAPIISLSEASRLEQQNDLSQLDWDVIFAEMDAQELRAREEAKEAAQLEEELNGTVIPGSYFFQ